MRTMRVRSIYDQNHWQVWAIPVQGPRKLVEICSDKREAVEAARTLNHATPWVFHDVRRLYVANDARELFVGARLLRGTTK